MQARAWKYLAAVGSLAVAAACSDDQQPANVTMPSRPALLVSATCDFTLMKKDARAYFVSSTDPVYDLMQQLASLNKASGPTAPADFKKKGFEILAYVGSVAGNTAKVTTPEAGDAFVRDDLNCLGFQTAVGTFIGALGPNGLFAVPTGTAAVLSRGSPVYGAEPKATIPPTIPATTWAGSVSGGQEFLLYGYPRGFDFTPEDPAQTTAAELATIPSPLTFFPKITGFFCQTTGSNAKLQHKNQILAAEHVNGCTGGISSRTSDQGRSVFALVRHVADWFSPRPLYATTFLGIASGGLGGLSPIGAVDIDVTGVSLVFTQQPTNENINTPITPTITVTAKAPGGTPLEGLTITLAVVGNSGSFKLPGWIEHRCHGTRWRRDLPGLQARQGGRLHDHRHRVVRWQYHVGGVPVEPVPD